LARLSPRGTATIGTFQDTYVLVIDLRARLQELNGRLAVPQIEPNARAHIGACQGSCRSVSVMSE
jgi:hypothetical protein